MGTVASVPVGFGQALVCPAGALGSHLVKVVLHVHNLTFQFADPGSRLISTRASVTLEGQVIPVSSSAPSARLEQLANGCGVPAN